MSESDTINILTIVLSILIFIFLACLTIPRNLSKLECDEIGQYTMTTYKNWECHAKAWLGQYPADTTLVTSDKYASVFFNAKRIAECDWVDTCGN